jgi:hypothetical protein
MKKLLFIFILLFSLTACNKFIVTNVYERMYTVEENVVNDIYTQLETYELDSIPLDIWITNVMMADSSFLVQRSIWKEIASKSKYQFIYTQFINSSDTSYMFLIRYSGKEKYLKK